MLLAAVAAVVLLLRPRKWQVVFSICIVLIPCLYFLESLLISPGEEVEAQLHELLVDLKAEDVDAISQCISPNRQELTEVARQGLKLIDISDGFHIRNVVTEVDPSGDTVVAHVRANGNVAYGGMNTRVAGFWRTTWKRSADGWKMTDAVRLDPIKGTEIDHLARSG